MNVIQIIVVLIFKGGSISIFFSFWITNIKKISMKCQLVCQQFFFSAVLNFLTNQMTENNHHQFIKFNLIILMIN